MKQITLIFIIVVGLTQLASAQAILLKDNESTLSFGGGLSGAKGTSILDAGIGGTSEGIFDIRATVAYVLVSQGDNTLGIGESASLVILKEKFSKSAIFLSFDQAISIVGNDASLALGGSFSHKIETGVRSSLFYSIGTLWLKPLNSPASSGFLLPIEIGIASYSKNSIFIFSPFIAFSSEDTIQYGVSFSISFYSDKKKHTGEFDEFD